VPSTTTNRTSGARLAEAAGARGFPELFRDYAPFVLRVLRHLGVGPADLNDQSQEVFVAVFRALDDFEGRSSVRTWIYGICRHVASNYRRRAYLRRERSVAEVPERVDVSGPHDELERRVHLSDLERLLALLDDDKREVFVLYELEELSMKEVAAVCDCPLQTAYSRLHAARRLLLAGYQASMASMDASIQRGTRLSAGAERRSSDHLGDERAPERDVAESEMKA
jgi:RNA polymerase sigma-70 factor (ECF subfamily)